MREIDLRVRKIPLYFFIFLRGRREKFFATLFRAEGAKKKIGTFWGQKIRIGGSPLDVRKSADPF